jgi:hypothetical protein
MGQVFYENVVEKGYKWIHLHPKYLFYTDVASFLNLHEVPFIYYVITFRGEMAHKMAILLTFSNAFKLL